MQKNHLLLVLAAALPSLAARTITTTPAGYETVRGTSAVLYPFSGTLSPVGSFRYQEVHTTLRTKPLAMIKAANFRRDESTTTTTTAVARTATLEFAMGHGEIERFAGNIAENYTGGRTVVFTRKSVNLVDWQAGTGGGTNPEPWTNRFLLDVPFSYDGVNDLVWEVAYDSKTPTGTYNAIDPARGDFGYRRHERADEPLVPVQPDILYHPHVPPSGSSGPGPSPEPAAGGRFPGPRHRLACAHRDHASPGALHLQRGLDVVLRERAVHGWIRSLRIRTVVAADSISSGPDSSSSHESTTAKEAQSEGVFGVSRSLSTACPWSDVGMGSMRWQERLSIGTRGGTPMDSTRRKLIAVLLPLRSLASMPQRLAGTAKVEAVGGEAELS